MPAPNHLEVVENEQAAPRLSPFLFFVVHSDHSVTPEAVVRAGGSPVTGSVRPDTVRAE